MGIPTFAYNPANQLTGVTGFVSGATGAFTYDGYGRIRTTTDADACTITIDYDALDRPIQATYPDGTSEQTQYRFLDAARQKAQPPTSRLATDTAGAVVSA